MTSNNKNGILAIHKPIGLTSFDVIAMLRKKLGIRKIGHSGTLDPNAEGLLLILVGNATKLTPFLHVGQKTYLATLQFGIKTHTADIWGEVLEHKECVSFTDAQLEDVQKHFLGRTLQIPPMVSALSFQGKRLYEYARENIEIERSPREIYIDHLEIKRIDNGLSVSVSCSSGTYVRVLCEDIAQMLDNIACMTSLLRTQIDTISLKNAVKLEALDIDKLRWISPLELIHYPRYETEDIHRVYQGKRIEIGAMGQRISVTHHNELVAIYEFDEETKSYKSIRGLW